MQLTELRKELQFNGDLLSLVETLKNVASSQYHVLEKQKERFDAFMDAFSGFFRVVNLIDVENPFVREVSDVMGIVVVTSDSGFMGGLNQGVIRAAMDCQGNLPDDKTALLVIGDKGNSTFGDQGRAHKFFPGIAPETIYEQAVEVKDYIVDEVLAGRMGKVAVAYPKALSFSSQTIEVVNILPCAELFDKDVESELSGRGKSGGMMAEARNVIIESSFSDMLEYLAGVWVTSKLYEVFEDSKLAEFSARAMHLEGSQQAVEKTFKKVQHQAFKAVHEQIDKGMRECFAAKNIKEKKKLKAKKKKQALAKEAGKAA